MRGGIAVAGVACLMLGLTSCTSPAKVPSPATGATVGRHGEAAYREVRQRVREAEEVKERLIERCMTDKGFTVHHPVWLPPEVDPLAYPDVDAPSVGEAERTGYGIGRGHTPTSAKEDLPGLAEWTQLPQTERERYLREREGRVDEFALEDGTRLSVSRGGCAGEVVTSLYGDPAAYVRLRWLTDGGAANHLRFALRDDPRVRDATAGWAECVGSQGFQGVSVPEDAQELASMAYLGGEGALPLEPTAAREREVAIATAHARCAENERLNEISRAVFGELRASYVVEHETEIIAYRDLIVAGIDRAQRQLQTG
ncbi:hypothetical protein [Micromonospora sp. WMMD964]|uniref:hypothetical protein n=1 Tax=Micromonospora sp. WMMD964 TaxID=3016091 RepID=UPI002499D5AF|nr:hypothetical protein [Micromonospora sp. WMMD964]WFF02983.1 hypothetical protein O7616_09630 [Micromonospora sp. WMMD964]